MALFVFHVSVAQGRRTTWPDDTARPPGDQDGGALLTHAVLAARSCGAKDPQQHRVTLAAGAAASTTPTTGAAGQFHAAQLGAYDGGRNRDRADVADDL